MSLAVALESQLRRDRRDRILAALEPPVAQPRAASAPPVTPTSTPATMTKLAISEQAGAR